MTDAELDILLRTQLLAGLSRQAMPLVEVVASNQPTTQGRTSTATVYFSPLTDSRYGWQGRSRQYDQQAGTITTTESQIIQSSFQLFALAPQDPEDLSLPTAKDLLNLAAMICNSQPFVIGMRSGGAGIQRVTQIRSPYFVNDQGQFEASPSFDITISHKRQIQEVTPVAEDATLSIHRV